MGAMTGRPEGFPEHRVVDVALRDGSTVRIRPVLSTDSHDILEFFGRLDPESLSLRFHGLRKVQKKDADTMATGMLIDSKPAFVRLMPLTTSFW